MSSRFGPVVLACALAAACCPGLDGAQWSGTPTNTLQVSAVGLLAPGESGVRTGLDWTQSIENHGVLRATTSIAAQEGGARLGRSLLEWQSLSDGSSGLKARAGTFLLDPYRHERPRGIVSLPSVLVQGVQTDYSRNGMTVGVFSGRFAVEEGGRLLSVRGASDRIMGVYVSRRIRPDLDVSIEADHVRNGGGDSLLSRPGAQTSSAGQMRYSLRWAPSLADIEGEYAISNAGRPSWHMSVERDAGWIGFRGAYVKRDLNYLPFGLLAYSGDRQGPSAEVTIRPASWLNVSGSFNALRSNVARRSGAPTVRSRQGNLNASIRLRAGFQLAVAHSASRIRRTNTAADGTHTIAIDSATLMHARRMWLTRIRVDQIRLSSSGPAGTRGFEADLNRGFLNGLSLGGMVRWERTKEPGRRLSRISTAIRGGLDIGLISLQVQTDLGNDVRNETLFAVSNQRSSQASLLVRLSASSQFRFEYYGTRSNYELNPESATAASLLGRELTPVLSTASRNIVYVEYRKTFRWGSTDEAPGRTALAEMGLTRPVGRVAGRVCVDADDDGVCAADEAGVGGVRVAIGEDFLALTGENGEFRLRGVPPGPHTVRLVEQSLNAALTPLTREQNVNVILRETVSADFGVVAPSTLSGRVTERKDGNVVPVVDAAVQIQPAGLYAYTDHLGRFIISNVPKGSFDVILTPETIAPNSRIVEGPAGRIDIVRSGQALTGIDFLVEAVETVPVIERLETGRVTVR